MTDKKQKEIFARNLSMLISKKGISQKEFADSIGSSPQVVNTWLHGNAFPRMGKVQRIADYFGVLKSDLLEDKTDIDNIVPIDTDRQLILEKIKDFTPTQLARLTAYIDFMNFEGK